MTKRISALVLALVLCLAALGCEGETVSPLPSASPAPVGTAEPTPEAGVDAPAGFEEKARTVYFPEGATEADAEYILTYSLPVFDESAEAANAAVSLYEEELLDRVREERLPLADRAEGEAAPSTDVSLAVTRTSDAAGGYWSIALFETVTFGDEVETLPFVLVLDGAGSEQSFAAISGLYEPDDIVAQQLYNAIDRAPENYFGDLALDDVRLALDLYNGFAVTEAGYDIFIRAGALAPVEQGVLTFSLPREALYPACVGEALSVAEYEALLPALRALAAAASPYYEGFADGSPSAFAASAFLTAMLTTGNEADPTVEVPAAEYEAAFASYFTGSLPADLAEWGDGTMLVDGAYHLPVRPRASYALRVDDAVREADALTLYGMLLYGAPGSADAGELTAVTLVLAPDADAPALFRFVSLTLS